MKYWGTLDNWYKRKGTVGGFCVHQSRWAKNPHSYNWQGKTVAFIDPKQKILGGTIFITTLSSHPIPVLLRLLRRKKK